MNSNQADELKKINRAQANSSDTGQKECTVSKRGEKSIIVEASKVLLCKSGNSFYFISDINSAKFLKFTTIIKK